jgi:hypothetical protein
MIPRAGICEKGEIPGPRAEPALGRGGGIPYYPAEFRIDSP